MMPFFVLYTSKLHVIDLLYPLAYTLSVKYLAPRKPFYSLRTGKLMTYYQSISRLMNLNITIVVA